MLYWKMSSATRGHVTYDGVMAWDHFSNYWPFLMIIQRSAADSPHKELMMHDINIFFDVILNKLFNKHSCLVELPVIWDTLTLMWQHCNKWGSVTQKWQACRPGLITNRTSLRLFV